MPKRIVICSDGTGNTGIKGRGTNVFKVFEAVDLDTHRFDPTVTPQIAIYDDGVGTENFKPLKILGGATGWGLSRNVRYLYAELSRVYDPGDEIYMFGFSRGAFTVRTLIGLIATCGIVDLTTLEPATASTFERSVKAAYKAYRKCYAPSWRSALSKARVAPGAAFKRRCAHSHDVRIRFVGVWDTVDAVGLPFRLADLINATVYRFKFPDLVLSRIVDTACHALAIDEERQSFHPLMWTETPEDRDRILQVWFAGAHSNVGGGYPKQGMSLVALDWMLEQAERAGDRFNEHGLRLNKGERAWFREHATVDDKLYDSRSGLGVLYRWKQRDIASICAYNGVQPRVHVSALERIAHGTAAYSPGNLPSNAVVVFTAPPDTEHSGLANERALAGQQVLATVPGVSLLSAVPWLRRMGQFSYWLGTGSCVAVLVAACVADPESLVNEPRSAFAAVAALLFGLITSPAAMGTQLLKNIYFHWWLTGFLVIGMATAYVLSLLIDLRMSDTFSEFWFAKQQELRARLKAARQDVLRGGGGAHP